MQKKPILAFILSCIALVGFTLQLAHADSHQTALDRYVNKDDGFYAWEFVRTFEESGLVIHELNVTSQKWMSEAEVSRAIWQHQVFIYIPKLANIEFRKGDIEGAIVYLGGGFNHKSYGVDDLLVTGSNLTQQIVIEIKQIPNQRMTITGDGDTQYEEDYLISLTFEKFLDTGNEEWPVHLPMVKSVVKGIDAAFEYLDDIGYSALNKVSLIGDSKRGWTAWLAGAVDDRVVAILPAVIDVLDIAESLEQQWESVGYYSPILATYFEKNLPCRFKTPEGKSLLEFVDPIYYQDRLKGKKKYLLNGSGDHFFSNTNATHYWDKVSEPKHLRYVPNSGHGATEESVATYFIWAADALHDGLELPEPEIRWQADRDKNQLIVTSTQLPLLVKYWSAESAVRDFRTDVVGDQAWNSKTLTIFDMRLVWKDTDGNGLPELVYQYTQPLTAPEGTGYKGNYFTLNFGVYTYSTSIYVTPDVFEFDGLHCQ